MIPKQSRYAKGEVVLRLKSRLLSDDMVGLKQAAITGLDIVALPGYVCRVWSISADIAHMACWRFHDHGSHSVPAGTSAIGPRLR